MEALELLELLTGGGEQDRLTGHRLDRQRRASARVAVELRQHDAIELDRVGEGLGDADGVLAGHRVEDEQDDCGATAWRMRTSSAHQLLIDVQPSGGVDYENILARRRRTLERPAGDLHRIAIDALLVDIGAGLRTDLTSCSTAAGRYTSHAASATADRRSSRR